MCKKLLRMKEQLLTLSVLEPRWRIGRDWPLPTVTFPYHRKVEVVEDLMHFQSNEELYKNRETIDL